MDVSQPTASFANKLLLFFLMHFSETPLFKAHLNSLTYILMYSRFRKRRMELNKRSPWLQGPGTFNKHNKRSPPNLDIAQEIKISNSSKKIQKLINVPPFNEDRKKVQKLINAGLLLF